MKHFTLNVLAIFGIVVITYIHFQYFKPYDSNTLLYYRFDENLNTHKSLSFPNSFKSILTDIETKPAKHAISAHIYFFNNLTRIEKHLNIFRNIQYNKKALIYGMQGIDELAGKQNLYRIVSSFNVSAGHDFFPTTFLLPSQFNSFSEFQKKNKSANFILKSNAQRQNNIQITNNPDFVNHNKMVYVVCQELLQNPFLIDGHKINLRIYILICKSKSDIKFYLFNNGFIYYTPSKFRKGSKLIEENITSGYVDREIYDRNPMNLFELKNCIGSQDYNKLHENIKMMLTFVFNPYREILSELNNSIPNDMFMLMGCDIAPDENLNVKIMEVNKGPDLNYKDERDKIVKYALIKSTFDLVLRNEFNNECFESI